MSHPITRVRDLIEALQEHDPDGAVTVHYGETITRLDLYAGQLTILTNEDDR